MRRIRDQEELLGLYANYRRELSEAQVRRAAARVDCIIGRMHKGEEISISHSRARAAGACSF